MPYLFNIKPQINLFKESKDQKSLNKNNISGSTINYNLSHKDSFNYINNEFNNDSEMDKETVKVVKYRKSTTNKVNLVDLNKKKKMFICPTTSRETNSIDSNSTHKREVVDLDDLDEENDVEFIVDNSNRVNVDSIRAVTDFRLKSTISIEMEKNKEKQENDNKEISKLTRIFISDNEDNADEDKENIKYIHNIDSEIKFKHRKQGHMIDFVADSLENGFSQNKAHNQSNQSSLNLEGKYPSTQKRVRNKYKKSEVYENNLQANENLEFDVNNEFETGSKEFTGQIGLGSKPGHFGQNQSHAGFNFLDFLESKIDIY